MTRRGQDAGKGGMLVAYSSSSASSLFPSLQERLRPGVASVSDLILVVAQMCLTLKITHGSEAAAFHQAWLPKSLLTSGVDDRPRCCIHTSVPQPQQ